MKQAIYSFFKKNQEKKNPPSNRSYTTSSFCPQAETDICEVSSLVLISLTLWCGWMYPIPRKQVTEIRVAYQGDEIQVGDKINQSSREVLEWRFFFGVSDVLFFWFWFSSFGWVWNLKSNSSDLMTYQAQPNQNKTTILHEVQGDRLVRVPRSRIFSTSTQEEHLWVDDWIRWSQSLKPITDVVPMSTPRIKLSAWVTASWQRYRNVISVQIRWITHHEAFEIKSLFQLPEWGSRYLTPLNL